MNGPGPSQRDPQHALVVDVFGLDPATGTLSGRRRFLDFGEAQVWPDGMTVDDEGMLWVALGRAGAVHRYRADGTLDGVVEVPTANPTSVTFGGIDGGDLYITTSWSDLDPGSRATQPLAGAHGEVKTLETGSSDRLANMHVFASTALNLLLQNLSR